MNAAGVVHQVQWASPLTSIASLVALHLHSTSTLLWFILLVSAQPTMLPLADAVGNCSMWHRPLSPVQAL